MGELRKRTRGDGEDEGGFCDDSEGEGVMIGKDDLPSSTPPEKTLQEEAAPAPAATAAVVPADVADAVEPGLPLDDEEDEEREELSGTLRDAVVKRLALEETLEKLGPAFEAFSNFIDVAGPYAYQAWECGKRAYASVPIEMLTALLGLVLCFFGGSFVTTIAAAEAFRLCGGSRTMRHIRAVRRDYAHFMRKHREVRRNNPNVQIKAHDLVLLALRSVRDPYRLNSGVSGLYTAALAVLTTLRLQFARTITLGASIGEVVNRPVARYLAPAVEHFVEADLKKWVPVFLEWVCRFVGVTLAFYAQRVLAAVQSSLRGGLMCGRHALAALRDQERIPRTKHDDNLDTLAGYTLAGLGLSFQLYWGYAWDGCVCSCFC